MSTLLLMLLLLSMSLARLEVTGCHWDRGVSLQPGTPPREAKPCHASGVLSLSGFPLYLTLLCERLQFQDPCLMVDPSREVRRSTAALLLFICGAKLYQRKLHLSSTTERRCRQYQSLNLLNRCTSLGTNETLRG